MEFILFLQETQVQFPGPTSRLMPLLSSDTCIYPHTNTWLKTERWQGSLERKGVVEGVQQPEPVSVDQGSRTGEGQAARITKKFQDMPMLFSDLCFEHIYWVTIICPIKMYKYYTSKKLSYFEFFWCPFSTKAPRANNKDRELIITYELVPRIRMD